MTCNTADALTDVLEQRGSRYGRFVDHAAITQTLKTALFRHAMERGKALAPDQTEALDMRSIV